MTKRVRCKAEEKYLKRVSKLKGSLFTSPSNSPQEGFEYFKSSEYLNKHSNTKSLVLSKFISNGFKSSIYMCGLFSKHIYKLLKGRNACFSDLNDYLAELESKGYINKGKNKLLFSYPNKPLWNELSKYADKKWSLKVGFTELPEQLIFKGKTVLFKYALVFIQEMNKREIDHAPTLKAGGEAMKVYKELGLAVNDIACWLRKKHCINCQSNHPMGGLTNTTPLAAKAGLGWQGHNGLLITPWYGQRQRIAPIFIEEKLFEYTDNNKHQWIEQYCMTCRRCESACPVGAIYSQKKVSATNIPGIGETKTCIDRIKCYPQFTATLGCSVCMKVCPFSQGNGVYEKLALRLIKS